MPSFFFFIRNFGYKPDDQELETRVRERTDELESMNALLEEEVSERMIVEESRKKAKKSSKL